MNIKSLSCPCNGRTDNPLDHYSSGACTRFPGLMGWICSILSEQQDDRIHRNLTITTTRLTQSCAREVVLLDTHEVEGFDWRRANSLHWGNILHADLHKHAPPGYYAEVRVPPPGKDAPIVLGLPLRGTLDCVTADLGTVIDYKSHSEKKQATTVKYPPGPEVVAQLSVYGMMLQRSYDVPMPRLIIQHGAMVSAGGVPWYEMEVQPMTEEAILALRPFGGQYTVADRVAAYKQFSADIEAGVPLREAAKRVPLMGRTMFKGSKCLKYCFAKKLCDDLEGIAQIE